MPTMPPILVADLFPEVTSRLLELLRSLSPDEWHLSTASSRRTVKDIASHLLDGSLRRLSMQRDGYRGYCSSEIDQETPTPEDYLLMYGQLFRAWQALAAAGGSPALEAYAVAAGVPATAHPPRRA